ncbi:Ribonuclease H-like protein [Dioscorea alata]|uniref:Ribonuclease H-like protein n=1 Tax=Dioscorea alata TaxID=55571 RepID=A0ACB7UCX1_DIOAL|nr:Ribonuclease H-like protein [Dioscorea alata]
MDKFLIKRPRSEESSSSPKAPLPSKSSKKNTNVNFNSNDIISDPGLRKSIEDFEVGVRDQVRRGYLTRGPCQLIGHNFPQKDVTKDAAFCFWCYLFTQSRGNRIREDAFTKTGVQNDARVQFQSFQNQRQSVSHQLATHSDEMEVEYHTHLTAVLDVTRFLLKQGLAFRGHDESSSSLNKGNFLELLKWYSLRNDKVFKTVNQNAHGNNQMTSPKVQKELANACASEITCAIIDDIGDNYFSLTIDEAQDVLVKEQMGVVLRYVNKNGYVIERFLDMVHVSYTSSISLKNAIDCLFAKHGLSLSRLRRQGYDGASNMRDEFNGLKALILRENPYARYIHCFAHQLQLVIVVVAKDNRIRKKNQESSLARPGDTHWGSHYTTILRLMSMWTLVLEVLQNVHDDGVSNDNRDQNIVQAICLIEVVKTRLQDFRETGWETFLEEVRYFCEGNSIPVPIMEDNMQIRGRSRRKGQVITHFHHYRVEIFCEVIDLIAQEMQNRFQEASIELLLVMPCLDPRDLFSKFSIHKLLRLAELYPEDFTITERMILEDQLTTFIYEERNDDDFIDIGDLGGFARKMVETGQHAIFPLIYCLIKLALVLLVATATVERVLSAMNVVKTDLRNKMGDEWMNDSLVVYIEWEVFATIDNEVILQRFQKMQTRLMQLPPLNRIPRISGDDVGVGSSSSVHR